jgi:hypothetical protein
MFISSQVGKLDNNRHELLKRMVDDLELKSFRSVGVTKQWGDELSLTVLVNNASDIEALKSIAFNQFNQEAVIESDIQGNFYMVNRSGEVAPMGRLSEISEKEADEVDHTRVLIDGTIRYYTIKK